MLADLMIGQGLLAGLSEGQRPIAHLVLVGLLVGLAAVGLVPVIRRKRRRSDGNQEKQRAPEDH